MSKIEIKNMSFGYAGQTLLFENVSVNLDTDWRLGLVGRNGRGKTTLLDLMSGAIEPKSGKIMLHEPVHYFPKMIENENQFVHDIVLTHVDATDLWRVERELSLLGMQADDFMWRIFASLSGGEQTKVLLAIAFADNKQYVVLDEPTNHLDLATRQQIVGYLNQKQGYLVVSHDRSFLNQVTDHTLSIEKSQLRLYQGNFEVYEDEKNLRDQREIDENEKIAHDVKRLTAAANQKAIFAKRREGELMGNPKQFGSKVHEDKGFASARAARVMKKSKELEKRRQAEIAHKETLLKDIETTKQLNLAVEQSHHQVKVKAKDFTVQYGNRPLFKPVSFELKTGEIIAITGQNGVGKSSLLHALLGDFSGEQLGDLNLAPISTSIVRQDTQHLQGTLAEYGKANQLDWSQFLSTLRKLGFDRATFDVRLEDMSRGQQKRVELAKSLVTPAELFIWDEPLNYLDVFNQEQLEQVIQMVQPTMLIIEHDATFLENIHANNITLESY